MNSWPHTVAILLGGQSSRMGEPKHLTKLPNGNTMLDAMVEFALNISPRVVVVGAIVDGFESVQDLRSKAGPVGGIEALLHSNLDEQYLVVGCDMLRLLPSDVSALLESHTSAIFSINEQLLGLPIVINAHEKDACSAYLENGGRSIWGFFNTIEHQGIRANTVVARSVSSVNTRSDLDDFALEEGRS